MSKVFPFHSVTPSDQLIDPFHYLVLPIPSDETNLFPQNATDSSNFPTHNESPISAAPQSSQNIPVRRSHRVINPPS